MLGRGSSGRRLSFFCLCLWTSTNQDSQSEHQDSFHLAHSYRFVSVSVLTNFLHCLSKCNGGDRNAFIHVFILLSSGFFSNPGVRFIPARVKQFALKRATLFERNGICNFWCRLWEKSDIVLILLL